MIYLGFNFGLGGFPYHTTPGAVATPGDSAAAQQPAASVGAPPAHAITPIPGSTYLTPAFNMAYPQMNLAGGGGAGAPSAVQGGGHVTSNPTNSLAGPGAAHAPGGFGMAPAFGMPVMFMAPVFVAFGYPVAYPAQAAPTQAAPEQQEPAPSAVEPTAVDVPDAPEDPVVDTDGPSVDVVPPAADDAASLPNLPIVNLAAEDFARYRSIEKSQELETSLQLSLTTSEGDSITLDFTQLDSVSMSEFKGRTLDGERMLDETYTEDSNRVVNMEVTGELSDAEMAAVDSVLMAVTDAVTSFFSGSVGAAVDRLRGMDFDSGQLAELSLRMTMTQSVDIERAFHNGDDKLHQLMSRDGDIEHALEFMATEQKRLIDMAKQHLDAPSAAKLVRSLLPPLMSEPFAELTRKIGDANAAEPAPAVEDTETTA